MSELPTSARSSRRLDGSREAAAPRSRRASGVRPRSRLVLSVLRSALAETTIDERIDDPYLLGLTREVRGGEAFDDVFDYARAFLLRKPSAKYVDLTA